MIHWSPLLSQGPLNKGEAAGEARSDVRKALPAFAGLEDGRGHEPRNSGSFQRPGKATKKGFSSGNGAL